jgi:dephospho-CoA kinase
VLKIGLTGGIASGKSLVAARLQDLGAVLIDADVIAREVVQPGTPGLARIVDSFGPGILLPDGTLDRARLGGVVFQDPGLRSVLNGIVHPLVREKAAAMMAAAGAGDVVVQDIPLLVETGQQSSFHLVVVVDAPDPVRIRRMVELRNMAEDEARSRIAAQAERSVRLSAADVVLGNDGTPAELLGRVDLLWQQRLAPYAANLQANTPAKRTCGPVLVPADPDWARQAGLIGERLRRAAPCDVLAVDHIGSTSVPGLDAKDIIDLQLTVRDLDTADRIAPLLAAAGFPRWPGKWSDMPKPSHPDPLLWRKELHGNADPGRAVNLHVRAAGSPGWRFALCFRDWLRANPDAVRDYLAEKRRVAALHEGDASAGRYASDKEPWFTRVADPAMEEWARRTGWSPPSYAFPGT